MQLVLAFLAAQSGIAAFAAEPAAGNIPEPMLTSADDGPIEVPPCSGHGSLSCDCNRGYEGVNCDEEIDWCARRQDNFQGEFNNSAICGPYGICISEAVKGASCACHSGYSGPFCATPPPDSFVAHRCVQPEIPIEAGSSIVHCADDERCLLDDLDCAHSRNADVVEHCKSQKGYCLPDEKVKEILAQKQRQKERQIKCDAASNTYKSSVASAAKCVHGLGTCTCDPGYEGFDCSQEVDFCSQPCPALDGGEMGDVCGPHGTCRNSHEGIECICEDGFTGIYCNRAPGELIEAKRCVLNNQPTRENETVHCEKDERCITDKLNCVFQSCAGVRGYCLPKQPTLNPTASPFHPSHAGHEGTTAAPTFATTFSGPTISPEACQAKVDAAVAAEEKRIRGEAAEEKGEDFDSQLQNLTYQAKKEEFHEKVNHFKEVLDG